MRYLMFPGLVLTLFASLSGAQSGQQSNKPAGPVGLREVRLHRTLRRA